MLYSLMDCVGYISWLTHEGLDSTLDMTTFYIPKVNLQTDELFQKVYQKQVTLFNRGQATSAQSSNYYTLAHGPCRPSRRASGTIIKVQGHITKFYQRYNLTRSFAILQHIDSHQDSAQQCGPSGQGSCGPRHGSTSLQLRSDTIHR